MDARVDEIGERLLSDIKTLEQLLAYKKKNTSYHERNEDIDIMRGIRQAIPKLQERIRDYIYDMDESSDCRQK